MKRFARHVATAFRTTRKHGLRRTLIDTRQYFSTKLGIALRGETNYLRDYCGALQREGDSLRREIDQLRREIDLLRVQGRQHSGALQWLGAHHHSLHTRDADGSVHDGPLVSVVMSVWNAAQTVATAIESVLAQTYANWELIVLDDGSTDGTREIVEPYTADGRIRLQAEPHRGVSPARNLALRIARGEIVAYLDGDNTWFPQFLQQAVETFQDDPHADAAHAAQLVTAADGRHCYIRGVPRDRETFLREGGIDLNVFAHRRRLVDQRGGFDEGLTRLVDWDLILRYTRHRDPAAIPTIGGRYLESGPNTITQRESYSRNHYVIQRKLQRPIGSPLRVLYVVWDYPQLTETYVRWEIVCMRRWGVEVEVWSELEQTNAPYEAEVPVHHGPLEEALNRVRPHIVHFHWLHFVIKYRDVVARRGLPMTVRGHGFEFEQGLLQSVANDPAVRAVYVYPHFARRLPAHPTIRPTPVAFLGDLYEPEPNKDRQLVVRTASAKPAKDLETFVDVAKRCPAHRFVLVLGRINSLAHYVDELLDYNRRQGSPVDVRINLPTEQAAELVRRAGVYLHTYGDEEPFGMPISIAEAMATGAYVLVRRRPGADEYVGEGGRLYDSVEEAAALIWDSANWSEQRWHDVRQRAVERAYSQFADINVLRPVLDDWLAQTESRLDRSLGDWFDDDELQRWLDLLIDEGGATRRGFHDNTHFAHLLGIYRMLFEWGCDADVCRAGLFHSIYVPPDAMWPLEQRDRMRALLGERAESLAYWHCAVRDTALARAVAGSEPGMMFEDRFTGETIELSPQQADDLCHVLLADWLEKTPRCGDWNWWEAYARIACRLSGAAEATFRRICSAEGLESPAEARVAA